MGPKKVQSHLILLRKIQALTQKDQYKKELDS